jgi:outer membrane receptor protein involved in Fe transport
MSAFSKIMLCSTIAIASSLAHSAYAQDSDAVKEASGQGGVADIVVTAQKRAESINKVPMSITAVSGDDLRNKNVVDTSDLIKIVPGFTASDSERGAPIYGIRGIVFTDATLGSNSTVALYNDEVPMSSSNEARVSSTMDLQRVEVLKGPQGILFGQNSTAGAINFIAAKPTDTLTAGITGTIGRFDSSNVEAFVSGPIAEGLTARVAVMSKHSDGWQKSYTHGGDLGAKRQLAGRLILQWKPTDALKVTARVDAWEDRSDTQAIQLIESVPFIPSGVNPIYDNYPRAPRSPRAADWDANPPVPFKRDDNNVQASLRLDYDIANTVTVTSISAWTRYNQDYAQDLDGTAYQSSIFTNIGSLRRYTQELRALLDTGDLKLLVGGNYVNEKARAFTDYNSGGNSAGPATGIQGTQSTANQNIENYAAFANADYVFGPVTAHAGIRYTKDKRSFAGCLADNGDGTGAALFNAILGSSIAPGGCLTVLPSGSPGLVTQQLKEDNVSWRLGLDYQASLGILAYVNVSKGYKSGSYQDVNAAVFSQYAPATQESVLAYEAGIKASFLNRAVQFNAAGFYYDYKDKQLFGRLLDPLGTFGVLQFLLNIPKSRAYGAEVQMDVIPAEGVKLNLSGTYVNTKVKSDFQAIDPVGNPLNYGGLRFPQTPKWNLSASIDYEKPVSAKIKIVSGASVAYRSSTQSFFHDPALVGLTQASPVLRPGALVDADAFKIDAYATVDAHIGVADIDDRWRVWIWGKNVFNTYYWNNVIQTLDTVGRFSGAPATYGLSGSVRF